MSLRSEVICNICTLFLNNPVSLPCHCVVCKHHLSESRAKDKTIKCISCDRQFDVTAMDEFATSKMAASILDNELHLTDEELSLKKSIQGLTQLSEQFTLDKSRLEANSFDHFSEIRRQIDIQREKLKANIDEIALQMIEITNVKEYAYTLSVKNIFLGLNEADMQMTSQTLLGAFRQPDLDIDEVKRMHVEFETKTKQFEAKLAEVASLNEKIGKRVLDTELELRKKFVDILSAHKSKLVSCSPDKTIKIWDLESSNQCITTLHAHTDIVYCLEAIDKQRFASGSKDKTIKIWDVTNGACLQTLASPRGSVNCLKSLTCNRIASGHWKEIKIWNTDSGECIQTLNGHSEWIYDLACLPDGILLSCSRDKCIKFWNLDEAICTKQLTHSAEVFCLQLLPKCQLASGSEDTNIQIWDMERGECVKTLSGHTSYVRKLLLWENDLLISSSKDNSMRIWDLNSGICVKCLTGHVDLVRSMQMMQAATLFSCSCDGTIKKWDLERDTCIEITAGH